MTLKRFGYLINFQIKNIIKNQKMNIMKIDYKNINLLYEKYQ